ncbi:MAG TPA: phage tail tape measure protein [Clostridium sp.]
MSEDLQLSVKLALESQNFQQQISSINRQMSVVQSSFTAASGRLGEFGSATDKLRAKSASLNTQLELAKSKTDMYATAVEKSKSKLADSVTAQEKLSTKIAATTRAYEASVIATGADSEKSKALQSEITNLNKQYNDGNSIIANNSRALDNNSIRQNNAQRASNTLEGQIRTTDSQILIQDSHWTTLGNTLTTSGKKMKDYGDKAAKIGKTLSIGITAPVVGLATASIKTAAVFSHEMADIRKEVDATSGSVSNTNNIMANMSKSSIAWSEQFGQSTDDINASLLTLVKDGYNGKVAMDIMGISLNTARGSNEDLTTTVNTLGTSLEAYGMKTTNAAQTTANMTKMADTFAYIANHTKASVSSLGEAFSIVGPTASALKIPFTEVAAAIGKLQSNGIDANTAATSLKAGLVNLTKPTAKMTKAMKDMGLSAFDANGNMKTLPEILSNIEQGTKGFTNQQKMADIATVFGKESLASWTVLLKNGAPALTTLSDNAGNATGEVKKLADSMKNTDVNKFNELKNSAKALGIVFGQDILPTLTPIIDKLTEMIKGFSAMSDSNKKLIVDIALVAAAIGPLLVTAGKFASAIGSIKLLLGTASTAMGVAAGATEGVGVATGVASGGLGTMALAAGAALIPFLPLIVGVGLLVAAGFAIHNALTKSATPAVDLFADSTKTSSKAVADSNGMMGTSFTEVVTKISAGTKAAVGSYMELDKKATASLNNLYDNSTVITAKNSAGVVAQYQGMADKIKGGLETRYQDEYSTMKASFDKRNVLSKDEEAKILAKMKTDTDNKKAVEDGYVKQIADIYKKASDDKRKTTTDEEQQIKSIQDKMRVNAVTDLSETEVQSKVILQRLSDYGKNITAQQASDEIHNANKARDGSVQAANDQYNKSVAEFIRQRDETHTITASQADKLIADAKKQKDQSIAHAEGLRSGVVNKITSMNSSIGNSVSTTTGDILTKWDKLQSWWDGWSPSIKKFVSVMTGTPTSPTVSAHATGTDNYEGGLTTLHEKGYEVYNLPKASKIYNHDASEALVMQTAKQVAQGVLASAQSSNQGGTQTIIVPVTLDGKEIARVVVNPISKLLENKRRQGATAMGGSY